MAFIDEQCKEINLHIRHVAQLLVAWYTFFSTGNLLAMGWFVTTSPPIKLTPSAAAFGSCIILAVISLGVVALIAIGRYLAEANARLENLIREIVPDPSLSSSARASPVPMALYLQVTRIRIYPCGCF